MEDYKTSIKTDSIFLASDNSNKILIIRCELYLKQFENSYKDSITDIFLNEKELEYYKTQIAEKKWSRNISLIYVNFSDSHNKRIYVTKPIYTQNKKHALIASFSKDKDHEYHFIPKILVYEKEKDNWKKIHVIPSQGFTSFEQGKPSEN